MIALPEQDRVEMMLLSLAYRSYHSRGDRNRAESVIGANTDRKTGIARSIADLIPENAALRGRDFVTACPIDPENLALVSLRREEPDGSEPLFMKARGWAIVVERPDVTRPGTTREDVVDVYPRLEKAKAEAEVEHLARHEPTWKVGLREVEGRGALTGEEADAAREMKARFQKALYVFAEKGWVALEPPTVFEPAGPAHLESKNDASQYRCGVDDAGNIFIARWTNEGVDAALELVEQDPYWSQRGAFSSLAGADKDAQNAAAADVPWAHSLWKSEQQQG